MLMMMQIGMWASPSPNLLGDEPLPGAQYYNFSSLLVLLNS